MLFSTMNKAVLAVLFLARGSTAHFYSPDRELVAKATAAPKVKATPTIHTASPSSAPSEATCFRGDEATVNTLCDGRCCVGLDACTWWGDREHTVCLGSCMGDYACHDWGKANGENYIAMNSCVGDESCYDWGNSTYTVGENSCLGTESCHAIAYETNGSEITIGTDSCVAEYACWETAWFGEIVNIGDNSCRGSSACSWLGFDLAGVIDIGDGACAADGITEDSVEADPSDQCYYVGGGDATKGTIQIEDGACYGNEACSQLAERSVTFVRLVIEANACRGDNVCQECRKDDCNAYGHPCTTLRLNDDTCAEATCSDNSCEFNPTSY